jgi:hypothetical protein
VLHPVKPCLQGGEDAIASVGVRGDRHSLPVRLLRRRFGEYRLMIEPVILGGGKRLFPDDGRAHALELVATTVSKTVGAHLHLPASP